MNLIIGYGEIGRAVHAVIGEAKVYDNNGTGTLEKCEVLHICFPYSDDFIRMVKFYKKRTQAKHVIIYSTVAIGTTRSIPGAVHSPVEGKHPDLAESIRLMPRWIGSKDEDERSFFCDFFLHKGLKVRWVKDSNFTEFLKLRSTSKYGINLAWADYEARVAKKLRMDILLVQAFDNDYNKLYRDMGMDWAQRYILTPPNGKIGGHCVVPNAEILDEQFPDDLVKKIKEFR